MRNLKFYTILGLSALFLLAPSCGSDGSVSFDASEDWLMIPASDNGAAVTLRILADGENILGEAQTYAWRLAVPTITYL